MALARGLTGVGGSEVVRVAGEESLVVLSRQVHVVVGERLSTCDPRIPAQTGPEHSEGAGLTGKYYLGVFYAAFS